MKSNSRLRPRGSISPRALYPACSSQCTVCHLGIPSVGRSVLRSARRSHWRWFTGFSHRCKTRSPRPNAPPGTGHWTWDRGPFGAGAAPTWISPWSRAQLLLPAKLAIRRCRPGLPTPLAALPPRWPLPSVQQPEINTCGGQVHLGGSWRSLNVFY